MEEAKKMTCYKRLIFKQFVHVSGLCGPQFLSYLPKRFTHLCRALYGDAILVYRFGAPIWPSEINNLLFTRELVYVRINISSNTWNGYTAENQEERLFFNETAFLFWCHALWKLGSSNCCIFEMKHATGMETCTKIYFLFIFNLVKTRIRKTSLFWVYNFMTSLWKPSIQSYFNKRTRKQMCMQQLQNLYQIWQIS